MFWQSPLQILLVFISFLFRDVVGACEQSPWTRACWDITREDLMQMFQEKFNGIHILSASCTVALLIIVVLSLCYIILKWKITRWRKGTVQAPVPSGAIEMATEYPPDTEKVLLRLVVNTSKMVKYMRCLYHYEKRARDHRSRNKAKVEEADQEQLFPVCFWCCRSGGDTAKRGI